MKISYEFLNGDKVEIDVDEKWNRVLLELDRLEYNNNQKETRRHTSYDTGCEDGEWMLDNHANTEEQYEEKEEHRRIEKTLNKLSESQYKTLVKLDYEGYQNEEYAKNEGIAPASVSITHERAIKNFKKIF